MTSFAVPQHVAVVIATLLLFAGFASFAAAQADAQERREEPREYPDPEEIEFGAYAVRGPAFSAGFLLGRARADIAGAESFSRNWFLVNLGAPLAELIPEALFSLEYSFQVALDVDGGTGLRPILVNGEFEYFFPLDPEGSSEISLFGSLGLGWQHFDFDFEGTRNFLLSAFQLGSRFYVGAGVFFQFGFSYQRATGLSTEALDFDYWNFSLMLGVRLP